LSAPCPPLVCLLSASCLPPSISDLTLLLPPLFISFRDLPLLSLH
jgi:hypothetical protein